MALRIFTEAIPSPRADMEPFGNRDVYDALEFLDIGG
jgi:hypothetical protein